MKRVSLETACAWILFLAAWGVIGFVGIQSFTGVNETIQSNRRGEDVKEFQPKAEPKGIIGFELVRVVSVNKILPYRNSSYYNIYRGKRCTYYSVSVDLESVDGPVSMRLESNIIAVVNRDEASYESDEDFPCYKNKSHRYLLDKRGDVLVTYYVERPSDKFEIVSVQKWADYQTSPEYDPNIPITLAIGKK